MTLKARTITRVVCLAKLNTLLTILICGCSLMKTDLSIGDGGSTDTNTDTDTDSDTAPYCDVHDCWQTEPTNQTLCYDETAEITCTSFPCNADGSPDFCGQDAQYPDNTRTFSCYDGEGAPQVPCDGAADEDETVVDSLTGLEWQRTWGTNLNWQEAIDYCEDLDYGDHDDWRLPSFHELSGIVDFGQHSPAIDTVAFPGTPESTATIDDFFSSTYNDYCPDEAWAINFNYGWACKEDNALKATARCVRGQNHHVNSTARFKTIINASQEMVLDQATGLEWQKELQAIRAWASAIHRCEGLDYGGHDDWRLPNVNELRGLLDMDFTEPASSFPEMEGGGGFWTSTSLPGLSFESNAYGVDFSYGCVNAAPKSTLLGWRCVRGGP